MKHKKEKLKDQIVDSLGNNKIAQLWFRHYRIKRSLEYLEQYDSEKSWKEIESKIINRKRNHRLIYATATIAASLIFVITFTYLVPKKSIDNTKLLSLESTTNPFPEMGGKKAVLTLHTGEKLDLTAANEGIIDKEDSLLLISPNGTLEYKKSINNETDILKYNTLTIPRGGEYQLVLPDGTKVWLNAESSLHYPTSFSKIREVNLTGEAYFEVARSNIPFIVSVGNDNKVEVLGTKFNISAYENKPIRTTLSEGKVKVRNIGSSAILQPNQQSTIEQSGKIRVETVDAGLFTSWAHGIYQFKKVELNEIMTQLSRWYDVDISFKDENLKHKSFTGVIFRNNELRFAVETIERISNVKFTTINNIVYIESMEQ